MKDVNIMPESLKSLQENEKLLNLLKYCFALSQQQVTRPEFYDLRLLFNSKPSTRHVRWKKQHDNGEKKQAKAIRSKTEKKIHIT